MKNIKDFIDESFISLDNVIIESEDKDFRNMETEHQHKVVDFMKEKYKNVKELSTFFNNLKTFNGSQYECPMYKNSIYVCQGTYENGHESNYYYYDSIFIQFGRGDKYAIYLDKNSSKIAIANKIKISYSGNYNNKGCWLQEDGTYSTKMSNKINWIDPSSEEVQKELEKFKL